MAEVAKSEADSGLPKDEEFDDSIDDTLDEEFDLSDLEGDEEGTDTEAPKDDEGAPPADKPVPAKPASDAQPGDAKQDADVPSGAPADGGAADTTPKPPEGFKPEPLTFRADRQTFELPGSGRIDGFVLVPEASWPEVATLLSLGQHHQTGGRQEMTQLRNQLRDLRESKSLAERQAQATVQFFGELLRKGPEAIADFADEYRDNLPKIELEFERKALEDERKAREGKAKGASATPTGESLVDGTPILESPLEPEQLQGEMREHLLDLRSQVPALAQLTDEDVQALVQDFGDESGLRAVFRVALVDMPELGVSKGEVVIHRDFLEKQAKRLLALRAKAGEQVKEATKATATNAAKQQPKRTPPPTLPATTEQSGGEPGKGGKRTFKNKEEFDEYFQNTSIDEMLK